MKTYLEIYINSVIKALAFLRSHLAVVLSISVLLLVLFVIKAIVSHYQIKKVNRIREIKNVLILKKLNDNRHKNRKK